ncbi:MAG: pseudouridine synthase [Treponema sp.]|nr:pseudouridine synthase [Treponema sp.]
MKKNDNIALTSHLFQEPVDHILSRAGLCSDRSFKTFIRDHRVEVVYGSSSSDYFLITDRNFLADADKDSFFVDGKKICIYSHIYFLLNKPCDVVCSRVSDSHKTVFDFLPDNIKEHPLYNHLHIAGRLDADSHGLVLLTTNGNFSASLSRPETHVKKVYEVELKSPVSKEVSQNYINAFKNGIDLPAVKEKESFKTKTAELEFMNGLINDGKMQFKKCRVVLHEGKFRQIRRMFEVLGNTVIDLKRLSIGSIDLPENLLEGQCVEWQRPA